MALNALLGMLSTVLTAQLGMFALKRFLMNGVFLLKASIGAGFIEVRTLRGCSHLVFALCFGKCEHDF